MPKKPETCYGQPGGSTLPATDGSPIIELPDFTSCPPSGGKPTIILIFSCSPSGESHPKIIDLFPNLMYKFFGALPETFAVKHG